MKQYLDRHGHPQINMSLEEFQALRGYDTDRLEKEMKTRHHDRHKKGGRKCQDQPIQI